jgi:hypothetical protein
MLSKKNSILIVGLVFIILSSNNFFNLNSSRHKNRLNILNDNYGESWSRIPLNNKRIFNPNLHVLNDSVIISGYYLDGPQNDRDIIAIKYHINGTKLWEFRLEDDDISGSLEGSLVDGDNNLDLFIIVPSSIGKLLFLKIDEKGKLIFSKYIQELPYYLLKSVSLDSDNSIYITGDDLRNNTKSLVKLDSDGNFLYSIGFNDIEAQKVLIDNFNNTYISPESVFFEGPIYKLDKNSTILWKIGTGDDNSCVYIKSDTGGNIFALYRKYYQSNSTITISLVKINSSGEILNRTKVISGKKSDLESRLHYIDFRYSYNNTYVIFEDKVHILKYDDNCALQWNSSLKSYMNSFYFSWERPMLIDAFENIHVLYNSFENPNQKGVDIGIITIDRNGSFVSQAFWGGNQYESDFIASLDSQNNIYLLATCGYVNIWNVPLDISVLVKNPLDGGFPPSIDKIDPGFIFVFTILGVSSSISVILCISIIRKRKKLLRSKEI